MLKNIKLGTRLTAGFGVVLALLIGMAIVSTSRVLFINDSLTTMNDVNSVKQRYAINFRGSVHDRAISLRDVVLVTPKAELDAALGDIDRLSKTYAASAEKLDAMMASRSGVTGEETRILSGIKEIETKTLPLIQKVVQLRNAGDATGAHALLMSDARPAFVEWLRRINQFIDMEEDKNKVIAGDARSVAQNFMFLTILLCVGALAIGSGIAYWALMSIKPLTRLTDVMGRLAKGDNAAEIPSADRRDEVGAIARAVLVFKESGIERARLEAAEAQSRDELDRRIRETEAAFEAAGQGQKHIVDALADQLLKLADGDLSARLTGEVASDYRRLQSDFNNAVSRLEETLTGISGATGGIRSGSGEIAQAADDLSRRTEQQAASLEETAAALDEITATVRKTAEGARHASEVVAAARGDAERSGQVVQDAVVAMGAIERSASEISQIIGVIDEIAFQTNLLALNAGVEAARAGEAGRGFAVVASEVRALAQRSAEAAKEIKALISTSSGQVASGVSLVGETGRALARIVVQVSEITGIVSEISASAQEQATGLAQVNTAVNQMDQMTQANAAMVEQSTAASHSLVGEAEQLADLIGRFNVGEPPAGYRAAAPAPAPAPARARPAPARPATRPAARPAPRPATHGNLALKPAPAEDGWEEF